MSVNIKNNALKFIPSEFRNHFINDLQLIDGDVTIGTKLGYIKFTMPNGEEILASKDIIKLSPMEFSQRLVESCSLFEDEARPN